MSAWSDWHTRVLPFAPSAPETAVNQALLDAAREFFARTRAWMEWLEPVNTLQGVRHYAFLLPLHTEVVRIEQATVNEQPMQVQSYRQHSADWTRSSDGGTALVTRDLLSFTLVGQQGAGQRVQAQVSLMPALTAAGLPVHLATRYRDAVVQGAKARLLLVPNTNWFQPELAGVARAGFEQHVDAATLDGFRGHSNHVPRANVKWI